MRKTTFAALSLLLLAACHLRGSRPSEITGPDVDAAAVGDGAQFAAALQEKALRYEQILLERHMPYDTVIDPVFTTPDGNEIERYTHFGDSAIWTGHYLAAAAFRYAATQDPAALENARRAIRGIEKLFLVPGNSGLLARCVVPVDSPWVGGLESDKGLYEGEVDGVRYRAVNRVSRDQYVGVVFGLGVGLEHLPDEEKARCGRLAVLAVRRLNGRDWRVIDYDDEYHGVNFHPKRIVGGSQILMLMLLQVARRADPAQFNPIYDEFARRLHYAESASLRMGFLSNEVRGDYYAINLTFDAIYPLCRLEEDRELFRVYRGHLQDILWPLVHDHHNAFFEVMYLALNNKADPAMAARVKADVIDTLRRFPEPPNRAIAVRNSGRSDIEKYDREQSLRPLRADERPRVDFLWQRNPYDLDREGDGRLENPGVDYLIAYWMGRFHGVVPAP